MTRSQGIPIVFGACVACFLIIFATMHGGSTVAFSVVVGIAVSIMSLRGLARFTEVVRTGSFGERSGTRLALLFGVMKLPFVAAGLYLATRLAGPFPGPLIGSIIMVYFCFVWFVRRSPA